jgi:L-ascorbate metabolism protein UlaG (beta-lactamase superfamily)
MKIQRLCWAGVRLDTDGASIVIDPLVDVRTLTPFMGAPRQPLVPPGTASGRPIALVTHFHPDHCDAEALRSWVNDSPDVLCPASLKPVLADKGITATSVSAWETLTIAGVQITALPAVDGLGADQLSWYVSDGTSSIFHGGDTIWHGYWWQMARRLSRPDIAFLPVNGAVVEFPGLTPSGIHASMNPEEASAATVVLGAQRLCPIHFGMFHNPPTYSETPDAEARLKKQARKRGVTLSLLQPGETVALD